MKYKYRIVWHENWKRYGMQTWRPWFPFWVESYFNEQKDPIEIEKHIKCITMKNTVYVMKEFDYQGNITNDNTSQY